MRTRDYVFWTLLTAAALSVGTWKRSPTPSPHVESPGPATALIDRPAAFFHKATYWLALWRLAHAAPRSVGDTVPPLAQELPDAVVNAPPIRTIGPDGQPLLDHGAGW